MENLTLRTCLFQNPRNYGIHGIRPSSPFHQFFKSLIFNTDYFCHTYIISKLKKQLYQSHSCLRRYYNKNLDTAVGRALYEDEPQGYRELKRTVEGEKYLNRGLSSAVYYQHIKRLRNANLLTATNNDWHKGEKLNVRLTHEGRDLARVGIFEVDCRSHLQGKMAYIQETEQQKRKKAYQLLVVLVSIKYPLPHCDDEYYRLPGVSVRDVSSAHSGGFPFCHLSFEKDMVNELFRLLEKENLIKPVVIRPSEVRFDFADMQLKRFVKDLLMMHEALVTARLYITWKNIKRPTKQERNWQESLWGKKKTDKRFVNVCARLDGLRKITDEKKMQQHIKEKTQSVDEIDKNLLDLLQRLKKKYCHVIEKYPSLTDMLIETFYPKFLQDCQTMYGKDKPYPKALVYGSYLGYSAIIKKK